MNKINLAQKLSLFDDPWHPRLIAELNGQELKLAKMEGEFVWHHHDEEDQLFLVIDGRMRLDLPDQSVVLGPGELIVVPRGVEHRPAAESDSCSVMLFDPAGMINTGNVQEERTRDSLDSI